MATVELTQESFKDTIDNNDIVIIDFWASWCGPCKSFAPIYEEASEKYGDVVFAKVNTEEQQQLAGMFQIRSIPTLMAFREQIIVFHQAGMLPAPAFDEVIGKIQELDMEEVRKDIEAQQQDA